MNFSITTAFCVFSLALCLQAAETPPNFGKLTPIAACRAAVEFARSNDIPIEGIDPAYDADRLNPGDSITALITLFERGGHKSQWLLCIGVAEPMAEDKARAAKAPIVWYVGAGDKLEFNRPIAPVTLRLVGPFADGAGKKAPKLEDQKTRITVNQGFLSIGLDQVAAAIHRIIQNHLHGRFDIRSRPFTEAEIAEGRKSMAGLQLSLSEQRAIAGGGLALESYTTLVQETPGLDELFYKVVKPPSIWSIVWHLGVKVSLDLEKKYVAPTDPAPWSLPPSTRCYTYPLALRVNNQPALTATLIVAPPRPPLLGCAGIVGMLAENPTDQQTYLFLRIISARRAATP